MFLNKNRRFGIEESHTFTCGLLLLSLMVLQQVNRSCSDAEAGVPGNHGGRSISITVHQEGG